MNNAKENKNTKTLAPDTREWLIQYTRQLLMDLTEEERNEIIKEYD